MNKLINWFRNLFSEEKIIIPLTTNGEKNGLWVECKKGDNTYIKLIKIYGLPLPKTIETIPIDPDNINSPPIKG